MKKLAFKALLALVLLTFTATAAQAFDKATFERLAKASIKEAMSGEIKDPDALIKTQKKLIALGVAGCKEYAKKNPKWAKLMNLVVKNADKMQTMSLDDIEEQWHEGEALKEIGLNFDEIEHFGAALSFMDTVLHPATVVIVLNEYKKTRDPELLDQIKDELSEVLKHIEHVN